MSSDHPFVAPPLAFMSPKNRTASPDQIESVLTVWPRSPDKDARISAGTSLFAVLRPTSSLLQTPAVIPALQLNWPLHGKQPDIVNMNPVFFLAFGQWDIRAYEQKSTWVPVWP